MQSATLSDLAYPVFSLGLNLDKRKNLQAADLQSELLTVHRKFCEEASQAGHSSALIEDAGYALLAWLDELVFTATSLSFEWIGYALVMKNYSDSAAGEHFFTRLEKLHKDKSKAQVLRVYGQCLLLGFRGKYQLDESGSLPEIIDQVVQKQADSKAFLIAESTTPPGKLPRQHTGRFFLMFSALALGAAVCLYTLLAYWAQAGS